MHHAGAGGGIGFGGNADIPTVEGVVVMGISVPRTEERLLRKVMRLSMAISACYLVYLCGSVVEYLHPDNNTSSSQWMGLAVFILVCGVGVPLSGYLGAKTRAPGMLQSFCVGEGCVACTNMFSVFSTFVTVFWSVSTYCENEDCRLQFVNGSECVTAMRTQMPSRSSNRGGQTVRIAKALCDNPWGDWYLWFVLLFCGTMSVLGCAAMVHSWSLRNRLSGMHVGHSPRVHHHGGGRLGGGGSRAQPVSVVSTRAVIVNRVAPPVPVVLDRGAGEAKIEMVPVVSNVRLVATGSFDGSKVLKPH